MFDLRPGLARSNLASRFGASPLLTAISVLVRRLVVSLSLSNPVLRLLRRWSGLVSAFVKDASEDAFELRLLRVRIVEVGPFSGDDECGAASDDIGPST